MLLQSFQFLLAQSTFAQNENFMFIKENSISVHIYVHTQNHVHDMFLQINFHDYFTNQSYLAENVFSYHTLMYYPLNKYKTVSINRN